MKILYVGTERDEAQAIATVMRGLGESVRVSWASHLDQSVRWIEETSGPRALVVETDPNGSAWRSVLAYTAGLQTALPVVLVVPESTGPPPLPLALDAYNCIARNSSLLRELPALITRAIDRAQQRPAVHEQGQEQLEKLVEIERAARADLEQQLVQATAAVRDAERRHRVAIAEAAEQLARSQSQYEIGMARAAATRDMVDEQFRAAAIEVERARLGHASAVAGAERLARREAELSALLDAATTTRGILERRLADAVTALRAGETRTAGERQAAADLFAEKQREFQRTISEEIDKRRAVEDTLAHALSAGEAAEERHGSALAVAAARSGELQAALSAARQALESKAGELDALATREADLASMLAAAATTRATIERRLATTEIAVREAEARSTRELAEAVKRAADREAALEEQIRQQRVARTALDEELANARAALDLARREHQSLVADVARLTERAVELEARRKEERATREGLEQAVADATTARRDEQHRHDVALATAARELADRQAQADHERAQAEAVRAGLAGQLREVEGDRDQAWREHQSAAADVARLTEREAVLTSELAAAAAGQRDEQQRYDAALATAAAELAGRQAHFDRARAEAEAATARLTAQLQAVEAARDQARREHQSSVADVARLTVREADLTSALADLQAAQGALELRLAGTVRESREAAERAAADRQAAAACEADLEARLSRASETIEGLQQTLAGTRASALDAERRLDDEINALRAAQLVQAAQFDDHFAEQRRGYESRLAESQDINDTLSSQRDALQQSLRTTQDESSRLDREHRAERERLEQAHTAASAVVQQLTSERQEIERRFEEARIGFQDSLDRLTREHAAALATRERAIEELRISLTARLEELEITKRQREVLQADADKLPGLHQELDQSRADNHRLFQQAPLPMFRCTKDGALTQANRMLTMLVGRRSPDELRGADFAASVFESPNDMAWLIERCLGSRRKESTETTWRRSDGSRLLVRLSACATSADLIECGVEDLTPVRVLQDRLSQAHRMEAVGRLAAEVAVTCGNLLRGIHENVQQWLMTDASHIASRQRGEMLLEEMSRAAGLLSQLEAYGDEESRRPAVVELSAVVRDIAPVLKRVAGDAVEVQLPAASAPLNVDAGAERVQRLLVNLAAYGRDRMPFGGRLKIELGTIVVDRHFTAKHPNVRLGPHALVTVTESRRTPQTGGLLQLQAKEAGSGPQGSVAVQPTVDLGTLQELVGECGGHLWMTVQPPGDMVVKIRLPLLTSYGQPPQRTITAGGRVRTIANWFQH